MAQSNKNPDEILANIRELLKNAVKDRHHGFHTPVFSNIDNKNEISSRTVVLRKFDPYEYILSFHSDIRSMKIKNISKKPLTYFVFYDFKTKIQLRIKTSTFIHYKDNIALIAWNKTKLSSRKCYLSKKAPSSNTNSPEDGIPENLKGVDPDKQESELGFKNFAVISNKIKSIDWLYLSSLGHKRLRIEINEKKTEYQWLIP